jgi:hypothetical protein
MLQPSIHQSKSVKPKGDCKNANEDGQDTEPLRRPPSERRLLRELDRLVRDRIRPHHHRSHPHHKQSDLKHSAPDRRKEKDESHNFSSAECLLFICRLQQRFWEQTLLVVHVVAKSA